MSVTPIGLDTAKSVFQGHATGAAGQVVIRRKLLRSGLLPFFGKQEPCTVAMEACGAAPHWARVLTGLHEVKLIAPEAVRPFVKKGKKSDAADAAGIREAKRFRFAKRRAFRPGARFVPVKSLEQQGILALHAARSLLVKQQTMPANAVRGLAAEFGLAVPLGMGKLGELMALVDAGEAVPTSWRFRSADAPRMARLRQPGWVRRSAITTATAAGHSLWRDAGLGPGCCRDGLSSPTNIASSPRLQQTDGAARPSSGVSMGPGACCRSFQ